MSVKPIPEGCHAVTPYLIVQDAAAAIDFYKKAFGATEVIRMAAPGGPVMHAELKIDGSSIMLAEEYPQVGAKSPKSYGGSPVSILLYVEDVDARVSQAVAAGARVVRPVKDQFYGDRSGVLEDPYGHAWSLATHIEDVTPEEIGNRFEAIVKKD
jgi:PhnB protein